MKKVIIVCIAIVLFTGLAQTNAFAQKGFRIGIVGGPQISTLYNKDDFAKDNIVYEGKLTINQNEGLALGYNFTSKVGLGLDIRYSQQGQRYTIDWAAANPILAGTPKSEFYQKNNYIKIPLMLTINTNPDKATMFVFKIGPQLSLLTRSIEKTDLSLAPSIDRSDYYSKLDYGAVIGLGARIRLMSVLFLDAGLRVDADFTNAENTSYAFYNSSRASTTNASAGLDLGLHLLIK